MVISSLLHNVQNQNSNMEKDEIEENWQTLMTNQFHDILPGTCIPRAHKESKEQTFAILAKCRELAEGFTANESGKKITLTNTLSFDRCDPVVLKIKDGFMLDADCRQQRYTDLDGESCLLVSGITVPAFSSVTFDVVKGEPKAAKAIKSSSASAETPFAKIRFDRAGRISSFFDKRAKRELREHRRDEGRKRREI